jgi:hypothetical protein
MRLNSTAVPVLSPYFCAVRCSEQAGMISQVYAAGTHVMGDSEYLFAVPCALIFASDSDSTLVWPLLPGEREDGGH